MGHLAVGRLVSELLHRFVDESKSVRAALAELTTMGIHRDLTVQCDPPTSVQPLLSLTEGTETECFDPGNGIEGEAVVDKGDIHVAWSKVGPGPEVGGLAEDLGLVGDGALVPRNALENLRADGFDPYRRPGEVPGNRGVGHHHGDRAVAGHIAVVQSERGGNGPGGHVVVHRHRLPVDGRRIAGCVLPTVDGDESEHLASCPETMQVLVGVGRDPIGCRQGTEWCAPLLGTGGTSSSPRTQAEGGERRLPYGAEAQDVPAESAGHREHGRNDRASWPGEVTPTIDPGGM